MNALRRPRPRGANHLRSQVYVYGNDREAKPLRPENNCQSSEGDFLKTLPTLLYDIKSVAFIVGSFVQLPFEKQALSAS